MKPREDSPESASECGTSYWRMCPESYQDQHAVLAQDLTTEEARLLPQFGNKPPFLILDEFHTLNAHPELPAPNLLVRSLDGVQHSYDLSANEFLS